MISSITKVELHNFHVEVRLVWPQIIRIFLSQLGGLGDFRCGIDLDSSCQGLHCCATLVIPGSAVVDRAK